MTENTAILTDESVVSKLNQKDMNFKYKQIERKEDFNIPTMSSLVKISELNMKRDFFSVKAKLTFGNVPIKMVHKDMEKTWE